VIYLKISIIVIISLRSQSFTSLIRLKLTISIQTTQSLWGYSKKKGKHCGHYSTPLYAVFWIRSMYTVNGN